MSRELRAQSGDFTVTPVFDGFAVAQIKGRTVHSWVYLATAATLADAVREVRRRIRQHGGRAWVYEPFGQAFRSILLPVN